MAAPDFTTIAYCYSQPEAAVMLSLFEANAIPAFAVGGRHAGASWPMIVALGGVEIRVLTECLGDAQALLAEIAREPAATRPPIVLGWLSRLLIYSLTTFLGVPPPPRTPADYRMDGADQ